MRTVARVGSETPRQRCTICDRVQELSYAGARQRLCLHLPITAAHVSREEIVNNAAGDLSAKLPYQPLEWSAITMYVNPEDHTMATLYGNETEIKSLTGGAKRRVVVIARRMAVSFVLPAILATTPI